MSKRKFKTGDSVFINDNMPDYMQQNGWSVGMEGTIVSYRSYENTYEVRMSNGKTLYEKAEKFSLGKPIGSIEKFNEQINQALEKIEKTQAFIVETRSKIAFMQEMGSDSFDENEFKAYHTLNIIEQSNMSKIEKAKAIAALISGK